VCICSKLTLEEVRKGFGDEGFDRQKRLISARTGDIWFINVYAPHGDLRGTEKFHYKLAFYEKLLSYLKENHSPRERICMLGDFNVALEDRDVFDPELLRDTIGTMEEEREALRRWDYIGGMVWKNKGMRIDYILVTEPLRDKVKDVYVDLWARRRRSPKPSDHAPLVGVFEL